MKALVTCFSQTGQTRKVAEAIFESLDCEKEMKELGELYGLEGYDIVFFGFPIIAFGPANEAKEFLGAHAGGRKIALFITHAAPEDSEELPGWLARCREAAAGADVVGVFNCQGELAQPIIDHLKKSDDERMRSFGEAGPLTKGQPDESRLARAREFAREAIDSLAGGA